MFIKFYHVNTTHYHLTKYVHGRKSAAAQVCMLLPNKLSSRQDYPVIKWIIKWFIHSQLVFNYQINYQMSYSVIKGIIKWIFQLSNGLSTCQITQWIIKCLSSIQYFISVFMFLQEVSWIRIPELVQCSTRMWFCLVGCDW